MLEIYHSNRLEVLLDHLVAVLDRPLADPFGEEFVVAQNQGMARWLAQGLAQRAGIAANLRFPLPARLIWDLLGCWFEDLPPQSDWDKDRLVLRIFACLPGLAADPAFAEPARYLVGEPRELKTYQLAWRVADLFDQYLVYRPELVLEWEQGACLKPDQDHWQSRLWRLLAAQIHTPHRAALFARLDRALTDGIAPLRALPERVLMFAPTALPPIYCRVLVGLAGLIPIHLFVLNPCDEYWADLVDEGRQARGRARALVTETSDSTALLDLGNPLLASWGHGGMGFQDQLLDMGGDWIPDFQEPDQGHLLGLIQGDILALRDRRSSDPAQRTPLDLTDESIQVQVCHGRHREVQVLHDRLLRCFATLPGLKPREIICMAPDIDSYAPHIDAVFGAAPAARRIPWSIADRRLSAEQPLLGAVTELLGLLHSRLEATQVLDWLEVPAIARRFGIAPADLARIRTWVTESGVRWGLDAAMRADLGLPGEDANSWACGLRRLFMGLALPPGDTLYRGVLPYPDLEGAEALALGGLQELIDTLGHWRRALARPRTLADWAGAVNRLLADLFDPDEDEEDLLQPLRTALDQLGRNGAAAGLTAPVGLDILRVEVGAVLDAATPAQRFLTGRVTFCNMVPMRSIPARVLCLLGMNGIDFPRDQRPLSFDLMAAAPRRGDRARREDDRHLFLEAVLSARERLYLSYLGRDQRDNAVRVPSVLVDELLDYCRGAFRFTDGVDLPARLLVRHPLQPFSRRYFDGADPRLWSYRDDWCRAAQAGRTPGSDCFAPVTAAPADTPESDAGAPLQELELDDLIRFLRLPAEWFLTRGLGLRIPQDEAAVAEVEPFVLDGLTGWSLRQRLLALAWEGRPDVEAHALVLAGGDLPHGAAAELLLDAQAGRVAAFRDGLDPYLRNLRPPLDLGFAIGGLRLVGWVDGVTDAGRVAWRLGRQRAHDLVALWVRHLVLNHLAPAGVAPRSTLITERQDQRTGAFTLAVLTLGPVEGALGHLAHLIALFQAGQSAPMPFYPETSRAFARSGWDKKTWDTWEGGFGGGSGESQHWAVRTALRGRNAVDQAFETLAHQVFNPLFAAIQADGD